MTEPATNVSSPPPTAESHRVSYPRFLARVFARAVDGPPHFYAWMTLLTAIALVGLHAWAQQFANGLGVTGMGDHVSWGLYIANFTFVVGLAAGGVMMVVPAYLYRDREMHDVVIVGELLAIASLVMALCFVVVDLGRPDHFWHLIPGLGRFNWPISMLTWDVVVLNGYLLINLHICGYLLYMRFLKRAPDPRWYLPFVIVSIAWAISVHTVTAFLYSGLGGRPFWNTALLAPRFLVTAFVAGPAFLVVTLRVLRYVAGLQLPGGPERTLIGVMRVTVIVNLFMALSEAFTEFYGGGSHVASARYLYFGLRGHDALVPWIWTALACNAAAATILLVPALSKRRPALDAAMFLALAGIWIEKGMGLIVPGFIPSTMHELVEYAPTATEWRVTAGIWAFGLLVFTAALRVALPVLHDAEIGHGGESAERAH